VAVSDFSVLLSEGGEGGAPGLKHQVATTVRGELIIVALARAGDTVSLACRVAQPKVTLAVDGERVAANEATVAGGLSRWVFAEAGADGRIRQLRFAPEVGPVTANLVREVLSSCQVVLPAAPSGAWEADEDGLDGTSAHGYKLTGAGTLDKTRLRCPANG